MFYTYTYIVCALLSQHFPFVFCFTNATHKHVVLVPYSMYLYGQALSNHFGYLVFTLERLLHNAL